MLYKYSMICNILADQYLILSKIHMYESNRESLLAHLTVVEPEPHVLLLDAQSLGQVQVDVFDSAHAAEAAGVGQHPLQRSVGRGHASC